MFRALRFAVVCTAMLLTFTPLVSAAPGRAALVAPSGEITGSTLVFTWNAVPDSTWYLVWIGTPAGVTLQQWFTADQARCPAGGTCSITLTMGLAAGEYSWYIQTWNPTGAGQWSVPRTIALKEPTPPWSRKLSGDRRFTLVLDGLAVLDNETGLVWERVPSLQLPTWEAGTFICQLRTHGGRMGWRLPSVSELLSVTDPFTDEGLPPGHPFDLNSVTSDPRFWTSSSHPILATHIIQIRISELSTHHPTEKGLMGRVWCVRGSGSERVNH